MHTTADFAASPQGTHPLLSPGNERAASRMLSRLAAEAPAAVAAQCFPAPLLICPAPLLNHPRLRQLFTHSALPIEAQRRQPTLSFTSLPAHFYMSWPVIPTWEALPHLQLATNAGLIHCVKCVPANAASAGRSASRPAPRRASRCAVPTA
eukprot:835865-Pleurochrysis_carterae.AAC.1